jgi:ammonia channel protein AmtB
VNEMCRGLTACLFCCVLVPVCSVNPSALCIFIALWHIVVYCPLAHMVWYPTGLIKVFGVLDFAGETQTARSQVQCD